MSNKSCPIFNSILIYTNAQDFLFTQYYSKKGKKALIGGNLQGYKPKIENFHFKTNIINRNMSFVAPLKPQGYISLKLDFIPNSFIEAGERGEAMVFIVDGSSEHDEYA